MNDGQVSTQPIPGIPLPAGTDDNGNPYWVIEGRKVFWSEMQPYIAQLQARNAAANGNGGGRGPEGMGQIVMPNIEAQINAPANPETGPRFENRTESARERSVETRDQNAERQVNQQTQQGQNPQPVKASAPVKAPSLIGDGPALTEVDPSSPASIVSYVDAHHKDSADNSSRFLSELLEKIVKVFSLEH